MKILQLQKGSAMHYREASLLHGAGINFRTWTGFLLVFGILILLPGTLPERDVVPEIINVSLVESVPVPADSTSDATAMTVPQEQEKVLQKIKKEKEASAAPPPADAKKKRSKTSLKKKTFKSSKVVQSAIDRLEENIEAALPDPLEKALERLKLPISGSTNAAATGIWMNPPDGPS